MKEVCDFLKKCATYYLATVDGDQARVRPFGTAEIFEDKLYIQTGRGKDVVNQMKANPKIEICAFDGATWLRVQAIAVADDRKEITDHMFEAYPEVKKIYAGAEDTALGLYLKDAVATFYTFVGEPRIVRF